MTFLLFSNCLLLLFIEYRHNNFYTTVYSEILLNILIDNNSLL